LLEIYRQVSSASLEECGEGSVLYFVENSSDGKPRTLSLCKVKTLEYRLLRKLRQKLGNFLGHKQNPEDVLAVYQKEIQQLCKFVNPNKPLAHYFAIAQKAFAYVKNNPIESNDISSKYISFLDNLTEKMFKGEEVKLLQDEQKVAHLILLAQEKYIPETYLLRLGEKFKILDIKELGKPSSQAEECCVFINADPDFPFTKIQRKSYFFVVLGCEGVGEPY